MGLALVAVDLIAAGALVGCGSGSKEPGVASAAGASAHASATPSPTVSEDRLQQAVDFAKCMRAHGVNMADPDTSGGGVRIQMPGGPNNSKAQAAQEACKHFLPNGGEPPSLSPAQLENLRKFAQCVREHGVNVPDPDAANPAIQMPSGASPEDPAFKAAREACGSLLNGTPLMINGGGPGGGKGGNG